MSKSRTYSIQILGRILEHLGVQMYKQRDAAIAELIANSWDANAKEVRIDVPEGAPNSKSKISVVDNGVGMNPDEIQTDYLVLGRNARKDGNNLNKRGIPMMARKGIGKLAGFGIASNMTVSSWQSGKEVSLTLKMGELKANDDEVASRKIVGTINSGVERESAHGTEIVLSDLKHASPLDIDSLHRSIARRFSRLVKGRMQIVINGEELRDYRIDSVISKSPSKKGGEYNKVTLPSGKTVEYKYVITDKVIPYTFLQGFSVTIRGKVAQAPPFYFGVESTASHQHGAKYFSGEVVADFLDDGTDDESDNISTDRQEISWDELQARELKEWGDRLTRDVLNEWYELRSKEAGKWALEDDDLKRRIEALEKQSQKSVNSMIGVIGGAGVDKDTAVKLSEQVIRAFEFRQFHDLVEEIEEAASEDPLKLVELLQKLKEWKVLESRAMLELIGGRLNVSDKLHEFVINDIPETASSLSADNLHDLLARMPWLIDPDWDYLREETSISTQLQEWNIEDLAKLGISKKEAKERYDFLALKGDSELVIVEIKRARHPVTLEELQRVDRYKENLSKAHEVSSIRFVSGGNFNMTNKTRQNFENRDDFELVTWKDLYDRTKRHYEHYRSILQGNVKHPDFAKKSREMIEHKRIQDGAVKRTSGERKAGLGSN